MEHLGIQFAELFPRPVSAAETFIARTPFPLFPEEEQAVQNAAPKRQMEYAAGRHCARLAMAALGHPPRGIPSGRDRAPLWPRGLVGSITHVADSCAAVVAPHRYFCSIGIDMENVNAVPDALMAEIVRPDESAEVAGLRCPDGADWPSLYFCLKEAAYKAYYPIHHEIIDFHGVRLRINAGDRSFVASFPATRRDLVLEGRYGVRHNYIRAACWSAD